MNPAQTFLLVITASVTTVSALIPAARAPTHCLIGKPRGSAKLIDASPANGPAGCVGALAWGSAHDNVTTTGWSTLHVASNASLADADQAWSAGFFEGAATATRIYQSFVNMQSTSMPDAATSKFLAANRAWVGAQVAANDKSDKSDDPYWRHVGLVLAQLDGLAAGYAAHRDPRATRPLSLTDLHVFNAGSDLEDVAAVVGADGPKAAGRGQSCSALVRLTQDDLFVSQVTWSSYNAMLRAYKRYDLGFGHGARATSVAFSSYPGFLYSGDDFYLLAHSKMAVQETTIGNSNVTRAAEFIRPTGTVFDWIRNVVANRLAVDGASWSELFARYNSGTYNNQFMVVDYKAFDQGTGTVKPGALWVLEQIPGLVESHDMTRVLARAGYWQSSNEPAFKRVFEQSNNTASVDRFGPWFSHDGSPRARIFARDAPKVRTLADMQRLMRYNNFTRDPLSQCKATAFGDCLPLHASGENSIAGRSDLNPPDGSYPFPALGHRNHGAIDAKITSHGLFFGGGGEGEGEGDGKDKAPWHGPAAVAVAGPTTQGGSTVFKWSEAGFAGPFVGLPDVWNFTWTTMAF